MAYPASSTQTNRSGKRGTTKRPDIYDVLPRPSERSFIVAATRSGKSTLMAAMAERYHERYPRHFIWIIDPKNRYIPVEHEDDDPQDRRLSLFPDGYDATIHGRRKGVTVYAHFWEKPHTPRDDEGRVFVVQEPEGQEQDGPNRHALFKWLFTHADVNVPNLLLLDESFDLQRHVRSDPAFRRILQMGGEAGIGAWIINQRPRYIDQTYITESQSLFIGRLAKKDDRKFLSDAITDDEAAEQALVALPQYWWLWIDQVNDQSLRFTLDRNSLNRR